MEIYIQNDWAPLDPFPWRVLSPTLSTTEGNHTPSFTSYRSVRISLWGILSFRSSKKKGTVLRITWYFSTDFSGEGVIKGFLNRPELSREEYSWPYAKIREETSQINIDIYIRSS